MQIPLILAQAADTAESAPPVAALLGLLAFGIAFLLVLILKLKLQAFLSLILASIAVSVGATFIPGSELSLTQIGNTVKDGMGGALGFIATIIGIGAIFGALLEHSGGTESLANSMLQKFGVKRAPWAMLVTGFIISIPVFLDVALVILAPLLYALARDTKKSILVFGLPLVAGMAVTHSFVPPTPGPVAVSFLLGVNLGWVILFGVIVGLPTAIICGPWLCTKVATFVDVPLPAHEQQHPEDISKKFPPVGLILLLIGLPIALILGNTIVEQHVASNLPAGLTAEARTSQISGALTGTIKQQAVSAGLTEELAVGDEREQLAGTIATSIVSQAETAETLADNLTLDERKARLATALASAPLGLQFIHFIGHPIVSLLLATLIAIYFLGVKRGATKQQLVDLTTKALGPAGIIILITGAGGVFKQVLINTGIADALAIVFGNSGIPVVVLAFIFAALVRVAQGSATVAMLTAAGLMTAFIGGLSDPQLALVCCAIAAGATTLSHVNDSGFWMISRYLGMTEAQTLKTWTLISTVISLVSFLFIFIIWQFV